MYHVKGGINTTTLQDLLENQVRNLAEENFSSLYEALEWAERGVSPDTLTYLMKSAIRYVNYDCAVGTAKLMGRNLTSSEVSRLITNDLKKPAGGIIALGIARDEIDKVPKAKLNQLVKHFIDKNNGFFAEDAAKLLGRSLTTREIDRLIHNDINKGREGLAGAVFITRIGKGPSKKVLRLLLKEFERIEAKEGRSLWNSHIGEVRRKLK